MLVTTPATGVVRLRLEAPGEARVPPYALRPDYADAAGDGGVAVRLGPGPGLEVRRAEGTALLEDARLETSPGHRGLAARLSWALAPGERCHAWGEVALPPDRRGHRIVTWNTDHPSYPPGSDPLYGTYTFLLGVRDGRAHGLLWTDPHRVELDLTGDRAVLSSEGGAVDLFLLEGPSPAAVLEQLAGVVGLPPLWPRWALGLHQSRWGWPTADAVRASARGYRERRIPCDVIHLDIDHMDGLRVFTWDPERYADLPGLVAELGADGFRVVTIADPGLKVDPAYRPDAEAVERGLVVRQPDGDPYVGPVWPGDCHFPDFTSAATRAWWSGQVRAWSELTGVGGIWNDMNEPAVFPPGQAEGLVVVESDITPTMPDDVRHDVDGTGGDHRSAHNVYGSLMAQASFEGLAERDRPFVLTRSGFAGVGRSAWVWTGDNVASWEHLRLALHMVVSLGLAGVPFAGADVGGFNGHPDAELYLRFLELGTLMPLMRIHCAKDEPDREPWRFGPRAEALAREIIERRYVLVPLLYTLAEDASRSGRPLLRPLWWADAADERLAVDDAVLLGDAAVAAPVLDPGTRHVALPLPAGRWRALDDGGLHERGAVVEARLGRPPLFFRCGAVTPLGPDRRLRIDVDPAGGPLSGSWYEDDGTTYDYRRGALRRLTFSGEAGPTGLRLEAAVEGSLRPPSDELAIEVHGLRGRPARVRADGAERRWEWRGRVLVAQTGPFTSFEVR